MTVLADRGKELPVLTTEERLEAYKLIIQGCAHAWSKNKLQEDRVTQALRVLIPLTQKDPYFLAHLTSWAMTQSDNRDLQVFLTYVNSLSSADGMAISPGSKYNRPNLRDISAAAVHMMPPKLVHRVLQLSGRKYGIENILNEATHFPTMLRTAVRKYLKYREENPEYIKGIKKAGLKNTLMNIARTMHYDLGDESREILEWANKGETIDKAPPMFEGMDDLQIAEKIREEKMPYLGVFGELSKVDKKISPVIAVAMLEQATGNQAVIMRRTFEEAGILEDEEVMKLFESKLKEAKTALDRVETVSKEASKAVQAVMKKAKAEGRKEQMGDIGKVFVHLDLSPSMEPALEFAKEKGAIIAEMVANPADNFRWGIFNDNAYILPVPEVFEKDAFHQHK